MNTMISLDPKEIGGKATYKLMIGFIVPRPIAFVSTVSPDGVGNLAPFSFFNGVSSRPPTLSIAITRKSDGSKKDTIRNIESTGEFVVNSANEWLSTQLNQCSADYPYGVDEMQKVGLTPLASERVRPFRVKESAVQLECKLYKALEVGEGGEGSSTLVVGTIEKIHLSEAIYQDGKILLSELKPIARLAGSEYTKIGEVFSLQRPKI